MTLNDWRSLELTQEILMELKRRSDDLKEALVESAGVDPRLDSYRAGAIAALKDIISFEFTEETHDN